MDQRKNWRTERVTVIGLGRFGTSLARNLHELGYEVTAIDVAEKRVAEVANFVSLAAQGDGTDVELLRSLQVDRSDVAIVAQGVNLEANVLTTLNLKKLEVGWVVAKALSAPHGEILSRIGADRVVYPEIESGARLAHSLGVRNIRDYISLDEGGIAKIVAPTDFVGHTLAELGTSQFKNVDLLLIKRGRQLLIEPPDTERVHSGDELVLVGLDTELAAFMDPARKLTP